MFCNKTKVLHKSNEVPGCITPSEQWFFFWVKWVRDYGEHCIGYNPHIISKNVTSQSTHKTDNNKRPGLLAESPIACPNWMHFRLIIRQPGPGERNNQWRAFSRHVQLWVLPLPRKGEKLFHSRTQGKSSVSYIEWAFKIIHDLCQTNVTNKQLNVIRTCWHHEIRLMAATCCHCSCWYCLLLAKWPSSSVL